MALKRKPEQEDAEALRYAGILGHRFVTTVARDDERSAWLMSDDIPTLAYCKERDVDQPRTFEQVRFKSRPGRKWRRVT